MKQYQLLIPVLYIFLLGFKNTSAKEHKSFNNHFHQDTLIVSYDTIRNYGDGMIQTEPQFSYENYTWQTYLLSHLNTHIPAQRNIPGGSFLYVIAMFTIMRDGSINNLRLSIPNVGNNLISAMAKEVIRFFKNCPPWIPATLNGRSMPWKMKQRILFKADLEELAPIPH